jgi:hypothetical protein
LFQISEGFKPCTNGADFSTYTTSLSNYSHAHPSTVDTTSPAELRVGFVDVEGQGDQSDAYDALLVTPLLLLSKVILFNWMGGVEKTSMLKLLTSLARAASKIDLGNASDEGPIFGHLHIVFRDWRFKSVNDDNGSESDYDDESDGQDDGAGGGVSGGGVSGGGAGGAGKSEAASASVSCSLEEEVFAMLMDQEAGNDEGITERNATRKQLGKAFASIRVWLFPAPCAGVVNKKLAFSDLSEDFRGKVQELRAVTAIQLAEPTLFAQQKLSFGLLSDALSQVVVGMNDPAAWHLRPAGMLQVIYKG